MFDEDPADQACTILFFFLNIVLVGLGVSGARKLWRLSAAVRPVLVFLTIFIVLRTALIKDGMMYVQAGAGIVADSNPNFEQQECVDKAKALFRAAEEAKRFASAARRGQ